MGTASGALIADALEISAGSEPLLRGVSFTLRPGEILALSGPSGLGKSQLLRAICGLDDAEGELTLHGRTPAQWGWPAWRRAVALVQQRAVMLPGSVAMNLATAFAWGSAGAAALDEAAARHVLGALGLPASVWVQDARRLSLGQAQRVALARTLVTHPRVLLLDEPTASLDAASAERVEDAILGACAEGASALLVSHDEAQVTRLGAARVDLLPLRAGGRHGG